jgi:hypothetical protein
MTTTNRRWLLAQRPEGLVDARCFRWVEEPPPQATREGDVVVRVEFLSIDPTQRGWIARDTYLPAVPIGDVVRSFGAGRVVESRNPAFAVGERVSGLVGWQDFALLDGRAAAALTKVPPAVPLPTALGVLGLNGLTAYFGLLEIGRPVAGETVVVSGAAGATGSVAAQIAKLKGCRVIGIAGGRAKCDWLVNEARLDAAVDYKTESVRARLGDLCPDGVHVFFDNVGGEALDAALALLAKRGRVVLCGAIAQYNDAQPPPGPRNYANLIIRSGRMEGFLLSDFRARIPEAIPVLAGWLAEGKLVARVDVLDGLERAPEALHRLFTGDNVGKQLVRVADGE